MAPPYQLHTLIIPLFLHPPSLCNFIISLLLHISSRTLFQSIPSLVTIIYVSVEFDPFGFSIKVPRKKMEIPRCNSQGDLYPLCSNDFAASTQAFQIVTNDLWHQRLGHPSREALTRALQSYDVSCNKATSTCHACQLGKHVRMQFILPRHLLVLLFN